MASGDTLRSRLPLVSALVAADGVLFLVAGVVLVQVGVVPPVVGLGLAVFAVIPAGAAVGLGVRALGRDGGRLARIAIGVGAVQTVATVAMGIDALAAPNINDIATDLADPPALLAPDGSLIPYPPAFAAIQREAYPGVGPLVVERPASEVMSVVRDAAVGMGWEIGVVDDVHGRLQATAVTDLFRFVDDVSVRVSEEGGSTRIDVRSRSRTGRSDLGTNAARIRAFLEAVASRLVG